MSKSEIVDVIARLGAAYPMPAWSPERVALYVDILGEFDCDLIQDAVNEWIASDRDRAPTPGQLRMLVIKLDGPRFPEGEDAWHCAMFRVSQVQSLGKKSLDPCACGFGDHDTELVDKVVRIIGSAELYHSLRPEILERRFQKEYSRQLKAYWQTLANPSVGLPKLRELPEPPARHWLDYLDGERDE